MTRSLRKENKENKISIRYFEGLNYKILVAVLISNIFFQLSAVSSSLFMYLGTAIMVGVLFFIDTDEYVYVTVSLVNVMRFAMLFRVSVVNIITVIYFVKKYLIDNEYKREKNKNRFPKSVFIAGITFVLYMSKELLYFDSKYRNALIAVKFMLLLIYLVDTFRYSESKKDVSEHFKRIQFYYVYGVILSIASAALINPTYILNAERISLGEDTGANQLGIRLAFCLIIVTMAVTKVKKFSEWLVLIVTALPLLYFCFATQSRTAIVMMIITLISCLVFGYTQKQSARWLLLMLLGIVVVLGGVIVFGEGTQLHDYVIETIDRFANPKNNDISNGRFELWEIYIDKLKTDLKVLLIGCSYTEFINYQAHNMFIEMLTGYGIVGMAIITWLYTSVFITIKNSITRFGKNKIRILGFLPLASIFITGIASHDLISTGNTINFCIGVAMIYLYGESDSDENSLVDSNDTDSRFISKRKRSQGIRRMDRRYGKKLRSVR